MSSEFMDIYYSLITIIHLILSMIIAYNFYTAPKIKNNGALSTDLPFLSVLIPARNEEKIISACLSNLIQSSYPNLEIKVLDDHSKDRTGEIVRKYERKYNNIKLVEGRPLPNGWLGKNWACHQLANKASGELLLFLDSDVLLHNLSLNLIVDIFNQKKVKMLSVFPTQILGSFGEWIVVPLMDWLLLTFLPLKKIYSSKNRLYAAANGQFIMFDRKTYFELGGHEAVKNKIVEDMELVRMMKSLGIRIITLLGNNFIKCRMYSDFRSAFNGFTKNFFAGFNVSTLVFISILGLIEISFFSPILFTFLEPKMILPVSLIIFEIIILAMLSRHNILLRLVFFPIQILMLAVIGINSLIAYQNGSITWKDRKVK